MNRKWDQWGLQIESCDVLYIIVYYIYTHNAPIYSTIYIYFVYNSIQYTCYLSACEHEDMIMRQRAPLKHYIHVDTELRD